MHSPILDGVSRFFFWIKDDGGDPELETTEGLVIESFTLFIVIADVLAGGLKGLVTWKKPNDNY